MKKFKKIVAGVVSLCLLGSVMTAIPTSALAYSSSDYTAKIEELRTLINRCEDMGICVDYEKINYNTIRRCAGFADGDASAYSTEINEYNDKALQDLYTEAKLNLTAYLAGTKTPKRTYIYKTGDFNVSGKSIKSEEGRPIYSIGVGHGEYVKDDLENIPGFGYNNVQIEAMMTSFIVPSSDPGKDYDVNTNAVANIQNLLKRAEDSNVAVCLLISTHYFPQFLLEKYPALPTNYGNFGFNLHNDVARAAIRDFLNALIPAIKDYKSLTSICLANEPSSPGNNKTFYNPYFRDYLKNLYGNDISKLNATYGSSYQSFDAIEIPSSVDDGAIAYDWVQCHDGLFCEYLSFMKDIIAQYTNVPTHVKIFRELERTESDEARGALFGGKGIEKIKSVSGLAGLDEESYYRHGGGTSAQETFRWYDMLNSIYEMPIYNSEDHLIGNGDTRYGAYQNTHATGYLWQSAMHGMGASTMWVWEKSYTIDQFKNSILTRPDVIAGTGKVNYELNRLAYQVNAFTEEQPDVAILYSEATRVHNSTTTASKAHMSVLDQYYLGTLYSGEKVGFITDIDYDNLSKYKVLIIPQVSNTTEGCLVAIRNFITNGGKVIIYENGISSLKYDEHNNPLDTYTVGYVTSNSYKTSTYGGDSSNYLGNSTVTNLLSGKFDEYIPTRNIKLVDRYGNNICGVDWNSVSYNGATLVNLCSYYRGDVQGVKLKIGGQDVSGAIDLITGNAVGTSFTLKEMTPMLIQIGTPTKNDNEIDIKPYEVGDSGTPRKVTDVVYTGKVLSWKKAADDSSYKGANVYLIGNDGAESLIGVADGYRWCCTDAIQGPSVIKIVPFNANGVEGESGWYSIGMSTESLEVTEQVALNGSVKITAQNTKAYPVSKQISVLVKDTDGNLVTSGGRLVIVLPGESVSFSLQSGAITDDCAVTVTQQ